MSALALATQDQNPFPWVRLPPFFPPLGTAAVWENSIPGTERGFLPPPLESSLTENCYLSCLLYLCSIPLKPGLEHVQTALSGTLKKRSGKIPPIPNRTGVSGALSKQKLSLLVLKG